MGEESLDPDSPASPGKATLSSSIKHFSQETAFLSLSEGLMKEVGCELVAERQTGWALPNT